MPVASADRIELYTTSIIDNDIDPRPFGNRIEALYTLPSSLSTRPYSISNPAIYLRSIASMPLVVTMYGGRRIAGHWTLASRS